MLEIVLNQARKLTHSSKDGLFLDDLSEVVLRIQGKRVLNSICWVRNPGGGQPLPIFEVLTCNWKSDCFRRYFDRFNGTLESNGSVFMQAITVDWYRGFWKVWLQLEYNLRLHAYCFFCFFFIQTRLF